ncbi:hypothetical protein PENTCL1PPCAC_17609, partial [Pristionchus entomophagus]
ILSLFSLTSFPVATMIKILLPILILAISVSGFHRKCYACLSRDDCALFGTIRTEICDGSAHCYTVVDSLGVELKGCSNKCEFMRHESAQRHCHTCSGDLCNHQTSSVNQNSNYFPSGGVVGQVGYDPYNNGGRKGPTIVVVRSAHSTVSLVSLISLSISFLWRYP